MVGQHLLTLEDVELPLATSIYRHPGSGEFKVWIRVNRGIVEIHTLESLDGLIDILQSTREEINQLSKDET